MIRAIIFDFFDVIQTDALAEMLRRRSQDHSAEVEKVSEDLDLGRITVDQLFERLATIFNLPVEQLRTELLDYQVLNEELLPILEHLSEQYLVGLLSDAPSDFLRGLLKDGELEHLFRNITISSEVGMRKPDPAIFEHILSKLGVKPDESIFIDDKLRNVQAAEELGLHAVQYRGVPELLESLAQLGVTLPSNS